MKKCNLIPMISGCVGMLVIILDGQTAINSVRDALSMCLNTLIPSLFPFFILSSLVTASLAGRPIEPLRSVCNFCRIRIGSESLLAVGILGGYPVGAANIVTELKQGRLSNEEAQRMAVFCNNAGPSFIFGILGPLFPNTMWVILLWLIQITSSVLTGHVLPGGSSNQMIPGYAKDVTISDSLSRGIRSMSLVCGWVILFRMILAFLGRWILWILPETLQILITGLLELSNGCLALSALQDDFVRFLLAGMMLSLGGICVWMQTQAVFPELNLSRYIVGRMIHSSICFILSVMTMPLLTEISSQAVIFSGFIALFAILVLSLLLQKQKKAVAF